MFKITGILLTVFLIPLATAQQGAWEVVATVDTAPIAAREFKARLIKNRSRILKYYRDTHAAGDRKDFWTTRYGEETPIERLRSVALEECVRIKVQQILGRDHGVLEEIDYRSFLKTLESENRRRREAVGKHQPVYGPVRYTEETGFAYHFSRMVIALKDQLAKEVFEISHEDLQAYFKAHLRETKKENKATLEEWSGGDFEREAIRTRYIDHLYEELIDSSVRKAKVEINDPVYSKMHVR